jgi:peroxiredoxin family protein
VSDSPIPTYSDSEVAQLVERLVEERVSERVAGLEEKIQALQTRVEQSYERGVANRATILVFSGEMDKLFAAFTIATGAAAMGLEVTMYFTFWGLVALKRKTTYAGKPLSEKMIAAMLSNDASSVGTSKMNYLGAGAKFFRTVMKRKNVASVPELIEVAREMEIKLMACQLSMDVMGITEDELIDGVEFGGVAAYIGDASDSRLTLMV